MGKEKVIWRYDPIIITRKYDLDWHQKAFKYIVNKLAGYTESCVFSYLDMYDKITSNMRTVNVLPISEGLMKNIAISLNTIAIKNHIQLKTCSEDVDLSELGVERSCCIDPRLISSILGCKLHAKKDPNQRPSCGCIESVDIGQYNTCRHGCKYCYANYSIQIVNANASKHNPLSQMLLGNVEEGDKVTERKVKSLVDNQMSLF